MPAQLTAVTQYFPSNLTRSIIIEDDMNNSKFKVYKGNYIIGFGAPIVITTFCSEETSFAKIEYHIFLLGGKKYYFTAPMTIKADGVPKEISDLVVKSLKESAAMEAKNRLSTEIFNLAENSKQMGSPLLKEVILNEGEKADLFQIKMTGIYDEELQTIILNSCSAKLRDYLRFIVDIRVTKTGFQG